MIELVGTVAFAFALTFLFVLVLPFALAFGLGLAFSLPFAVALIFVFAFFGTFVVVAAAPFALLSLFFVILFWNNNQLTCVIQTWQNLLLNNSLALVFGEYWITVRELFV